MRLVDHRQRPLKLKKAQYRGGRRRHSGECVGESWGAKCRRARFEIQVPLAIEALRLTLDRLPVRYQVDGLSHGVSKAGLTVVVAITILIPIGHSCSEPSGDFCFSCHGPSFAK